MTTMTDTKPETGGARPRPETIPLETLTDEELSVLTPDQGVVVSPVLAETPEAERDAVRRTAFRGLIARGIVDPPDDDALAAARGAKSTTGDVPLDLPVRNDVLSALTLRQSASAVVAVARTAAIQQDFWYAHLVEEVVLLENVTSDGLHRFALGHGRDLADLLVNAAVHPDAADGTGDDVELPVVPDSEPPAELLTHLGSAYLRADVLVVTREAGKAVERPTMTGLFSGPLGSWSIVARPGSQRASARAETVASIIERARELAAEVAP